MRAAEVVIGGLLLASGALGPVTDLVTDVEDGSVEGMAAFEVANYTGSAEVTADEAALWSEGAREVTVSAEKVRLQRYEIEGVRGDVYAADTAHAWYERSSVEKTDEQVFENATVHLEASDEAILSVRPDAGLGPSEFSLTLPRGDAPRIIGSVTGPVLWASWAGFDHHIEGPTVALGNNAIYRDVWVEQTSFGHIEAKGGLDVNLLGGTIHVDGQHDEHRMETGQEEEEADAILASAEVTTKRVHGVLSLENATLETSFPREGGVFFAKDPTWRVNGTLDLPAQNGKLHTADGNLTLDDRTVELEGNTTLDMQAFAEDRNPRQFQSETFTDERPTPRIEADLSSNADSMKIDGQSVEVAPQPEVREEVSLAAKVLGVLLLAWSALKKFGAPLVGLLTRDPLDNDRRRRIHEFVQEAGMAHPRAVERALDIPVSSVVYHLRVLHESDLLSRVECQGYTAYFPRCQLSREEQERLALLVSPTRYEIAEVLTERGRITQGELADSLGLARSTLSDHLTKLANADLVEGEGTNGVEYRPSELLEAWLRRTHGSQG